MLHQSYESHQIILDHLDNHHHPIGSSGGDIEDHIQSQSFYKKSINPSITSTSSPEPHYSHIQAVPQHIRVIKDGRQMYEREIQVTSSGQHPMGPPPAMQQQQQQQQQQQPLQKLKIISNTSEEPTSSIPDLGESSPQLKKAANQKLSPNKFSRKCIIPASSKKAFPDIIDKPPSLCSLC